MLIFSTFKWVEISSKQLIVKMHFFFLENKTHMPIGERADYLQKYPCISNPTLIPNIFEIFVRVHLF